MDVKNHSTLPTSLVSYWELEEASGTRVDSHGSNDLTDTNTVGQGTGIQGNCADFTRLNEEYLTITDASQSGLDITGDISISAWIKADSLSVPFGIAGKSTGSSAVTYWFWVNESGIVRADFSDDGSFTIGNFVRFGSDASQVSTGTWYHIAITFDISSETCVIYVDGSSVASGIDYGSTIGSTLYNSSASFDIGRGGLSSSDLADGLIDEVGIWTKVLSASEVTDLYNTGAGLPYEASAASFLPKAVMF